MECAIIIPDGAAGEPAKRSGGRAVGPAVATIWGPSVGSVSRLTGLVLLVALLPSRGRAQFHAPRVPFSTPPPGQKADAAYLVAAAPGRIDVIRPDPPELVGTIHVAGPARRAESSRDGRWVAVVATGAHTLTLVDIKTMGEPIVLAGHRSPMACAFHPDGNELWVSHNPGPIRIYRHSDAAGWREAAAVDAVESADDLRFSHDGATCFAATRGGVQLIDAVTLRVRATARTKRGSDRLLLSPDGRRLYVRNMLIETVYAVDARDGTVLADMEWGAVVQDLALSADGARLYVSTLEGFGPAGADFPKGTGAGCVRIVDTASHETVGAVRMQGPPGAIALDDSGRTMFLGHDKDGVQIIDTADQRVVDRLVSPRGPFLVQRWPGRDLVLAAAEGSASLISIDRRQFTASVPVGGRQVFVCFAGLGDAGGAAFLTKPVTPGGIGSVPAQPPVAPGPPPKTIPFDVAGAKGIDPAKKGGTGDRFPRSLKVVAAADLADAERVRVLPPPVTLQFKAAAPQRVVGELVRQTGIDLRTAPDLWEKRREPVTLDVRQQQLWLALAELGSKAGLYAWPPTNVPLTLATAPPPSRSPCPPLVSGPFLLEASAPNEVGLNQYDLHVWNHPDPRVWVMAGARMPTVTEAVDENGQAFVVRPPGAPQIMEGAGLWMHVTRPPGGGKTIARLAGAGHVYVVIEADKAEVAGFPTAKGGEVTVGGLRLRLDPTRPAPPRLPAFPSLHAMRITLLRENRDDREWERARQLFRASRLLLRGAGGRRSHQETEGDDKVPDGIARTIKSPANLPGDNWTGPPAEKLVIEVPTKVAEVDVPFLFENLPLPDPKQPPRK